MEAAHGLIVVVTGPDKVFVAVSKLFPFNVFIGEGLNDADPGEGVLEPGVDIPDLSPVIHKGFLHAFILTDTEPYHERHDDGQADGQLSVDQEKEDEGTDDLDRTDKDIFRPVVGELGNLKQVGNQLAHHLAGVVFIIIGKGQPFVVIEQILSHIALHIGTHHVPLVGDVIFADRLQEIEPQEGGKKQSQDPVDGFRTAGEPLVGGGPQNLRIDQIHRADDRGAEQIKIEYFFVRLIISGKLF